MAWHDDAEKIPPLEDDARRQLLGLPGRAAPPAGTAVMDAPPVGGNVPRGTMAPREARSYPDTAPPDIGAAPPVSAPTLPGASGRPQRSDMAYLAPPVTMGRRALGILQGALAGAGNPGSGGAAGQAFINAPAVQANQKYERDLADYEGNRKETVENENEDRENAAQKSKSGLEEAQTNKINNPEPPPKEEEWSVVPGIQGPNGEPVQQEKTSGQVRVAPISGATVRPTPDKPDDFEKFYKDYITDNHLPDSAHNRLLARKEYAAAGQAPERGEPGSYVAVPDPTDPIHKIIGWVDPKSGHFRSINDIPGMAGNNEIKPTGQSASREDQAATITRASDGLIADIQKNRSKVGNVGAIIESAFLGTPLADPAQAQLATEIASYAALQPAMHGFRGSDALKAFEKMIGGVPNNPDALIASINGIKKTAGYFNPNQESGGGGNNLTVQAGGKSYTFPDQKSADAFKKEAGIK